MFFVVAIMLNELMSSGLYICSARVTHVRFVR